MSDERSIQLEMESQLSSPIIKLNGDCFEAVFEHLTLAEMLSLRQTCKIFKTLVNCIIKTNYPAVKICYRKVVLDDRNIVQFRQLYSKHVEQIKQAIICPAILTQEGITLFNAILPQLERLQIGSGELDVDFYDSILQFSPKVNYLAIECIEGDRIIGKNNGWLQRHYPQIKHLKLMGTRHAEGNEMSEFKTLLELNPNIQTVSTTCDLFPGNDNPFMQSHAQIDLLNIFGSVEEIINIHDRLNQLYEQKFFKRMHVYILEVNQGLAQIASVRGMEKLYLRSTDSLLTLPAMPELKELAIIFPVTHINLDAVAQSLINVERVYIGRGKIDRIIPFLRHAAKLKEIKVDDEEAHYSDVDDFINLPLLNRERGRLNGARKVTVYAKESIFLAKKKASKETEFSLINLKRAEAVEWIHEFE